jgi:hypothetical protein
MNTITNNQAVVTLPKTIGTLLASGGTAVLEAGQFTITIANIPTKRAKEQFGDNVIKQLKQSDAKVWDKIKNIYYDVRSEVSRERYPYLYS